MRVRVVCTLLRWCCVFGLSLEALRACVSVGGVREGMCLEVLRRRCRLRVGECVCGRLQKDSSTF